jgi:RimJ/RimL family protein N-acetyltransferase
LDLSTVKKKTTVALRKMTADDLPVFFAQQVDPEANRMAAFTRKDPANREAFYAHWARIQADKAIVIRTILANGQVAGYVLVHGWFGDPEVSYWLGREFWGKGIATQALKAFLAAVPARPLAAHVAKDNIASLRVLQKCGFVISAEEKGFSAARGAEVEEYILSLSK